MGKTKKKIAFYVGGGLGDLVHHFSKNLSIRKAAYIKENVPGYNCTCYVCPDSQECINFCKAYPFVDSITLVRSAVRGIFNPDDIPSVDQVWDGLGISENVLPSQLALPLSYPYFIQEGEFYDTLKKLKNFIVVHPFNKHQGKSWLDGVAWRQLINEISKEHAVLIVGSSSDRGVPLMLDLWDSIDRNNFEGEVIPWVGNDPFLDKIAIAQNAYGMVVCESCWAHVGQALAIPTVLFQESTMYHFTLQYMEDSDYDKRWHPSVRDKCGISPEDGKENFKVFWGQKMDPEPSSEVVLNSLHTIHSTIKKETASHGKLRVN